MGGDHDQAVQSVGADRPSVVGRLPVPDQWRASTSGGQVPGTEVSVPQPRAHRRLTVTVEQVAAGGRQPTVGERCDRLDDGSLGDRGGSNPGHCRDRLHQAVGWAVDRASRRQSGRVDRRGHEHGAAPPCPRPDHLRHHDRGPGLPGHDRQPSGLVGHEAVGQIVGADLHEGDQSSDAVQHGEHRLAVVALTAHGHGEDHVVEAEQRRHPGGQRPVRVIGPAPEPEREQSVGGETGNQAGGANSLDRPGP